MRDKGGPAFPVPMDSADRRMYDMGANGMSLRDYFAAAALNGMTGGVPGSHLVPPNAAKSAYDYADAMLKAREQS